ncbi:MAG: cation-translocating P-type ATPase [Candidatus Omnitrophica bacterium]|nr:cation-translocating P-type ATPase [Candidatus Omnitrophota bacterium]
MTIQRWHVLDQHQVLEELRTQPHLGLISAEAHKRLAEFGLNELQKKKQVSVLKIFLKQFKNILLIILLAAIALSALIGEAESAFIIFIIVIFCAVLGFVQEYRAERAVESLKRMLAPTARVLRDGKEETIEAKLLVPGDILLLEAGDKISADARLLEIHLLKCDEASLTGESIPVGKSIEPLHESAGIAEMKNMVFTGTAVIYGRGKAVVTATGSGTELGKIAGELSEIKKEETPLEKRSREIGKWFSVFALVVCFVVIAASIFRQLCCGGEINLQFIVTIVMFAVALAVAAVPEALPAIVTGVLAIGMYQMARQNAIVRKMPAVETLGSTTVICVDKTGTLTKGEMTVRKIFSSGKIIEVSGAGYIPEGNFKTEGGDDFVRDKSFSMLLQCAALCNDARLVLNGGEWSIKGDPTEAALIVTATKAGFDQNELNLEYPREGEIPFSSERKRMSTLHQSEEGDGRTLFMKGATEFVLERCSLIQDNGNIRNITEEDRRNILKQNEEMAKGALRVLAMVYKKFDPPAANFEEAAEQDLIFLGLMGMMDPPRPESSQAVAMCQRVHVKPVMITGDHKLTAVSVAKELGIYTATDRVLTGEELEHLSDQEFESIVDTVTVYARVSPLDKLKIVRAWKKRGDVVAMTGDGVNDAPALKHSDIGIAMGITGTDVAKEAADMVLADDNFATIVKAIERGRWIYDNIKKYLAYLLQANVTEVVIIGGIILVMGPQFLPLLAASILYINLATDGLPALALGISPPDPDIMMRPPRNPRESIFSADIKIFMLQAILIECPIFLYIYFKALPDITHARTLLFYLFVIVQFVIALNCRSLRFSLLKAPPHKWLIWAIVWELVLLVAIVQIPAVRETFGITHPSFFDLLLITTLSLIVLFVLEGIKAFLRHRALNEFSLANRNE